MQDFKQAETWKDYEAFAANGEFATLDALLDWVNVIDKLLEDKPQPIEITILNRERAATLEILKIKGYVYK